MSSMPQTNSPNARTVSPAHRLVWPFIGLLALCHVGLAVDCAWKMSVTHDEYWHLPVGLMNWKSGRFDFDTLNPPLIRLWAALPLLFTSADVDCSKTDLLAYGDRFLEQNRKNYRQFYVLGRCMIILLSVATGLLLASWSHALFGSVVACLTAILWFTDPTVIAHGSLVTTDMGMTFFFLLTLYALWRFARNPSWKEACIFGVILGLSQLAKYTAILLFPLSIALWLILRLRNPHAARLSEKGDRHPSSCDRTKRNAEYAGASPSFRTASEKQTCSSVLCQWAVAFCLSGFVLNAGYLFRGSFSALSTYTFQSQSLARLQHSVPWLGALPVGLPRDYLLGIDKQRHVMEGGNPVYLDAEWRTEAFPQYFVMALFYKLPHSLHALFLLSILCLIRPCSEACLLRTHAFFLAPACLLLVISSFTGVQLGIRYILPIFPFLILFAGQSGRWWSWRQHRLRTILMLLAIGAAPLALRNHPEHIAYFNELAGGPQNGRWHLLDSNLDWGQDLDRLKDFLEKQEIEDIGLAYFGTVPPAEIGITYHLPPAHPVPGWYAVSVNLVMGRPYAVRMPDDNLRPLTIDAVGYFRYFEPIEQIGSSIDVYYLTESDVARWNAAQRQLEGVRAASIPR